MLNTNITSLVTDLKYLTRKEKKKNILIIFSGEELHCYRGCIDREVPGRGGVKDYAPNGTWLQEKHLEKYYETYREVLSEERVQIQ